MKESTSFPAILYHKDHAPEGRLFQSAEHVPAHDPLWVDTPAKFDPTYKAPEELDSDGDVGEEAAARGFVPVAYPTHLYRRGDADNPKQVATAEEHAYLEGAEPGVWKDTYDPRAWDAVAAPKAPKAPKAAAAAATTPEPDVPPALAAVVLSDDQKAAFAKSTVAQIAEQLEGVDNPAMIAALFAVEQASAKPRVSVIKALKARTAVLKSSAE